MCHAECSERTAREECIEAYRSCYTCFMKQYSTYMLRCRDGKYYTGVTNDIEERYRQHERGDDPRCFTCKRRPLDLVFVENFRDINDAIRLEKQIKSWSRNKKEALIERNFSRISELAKKRNFNRMIDDQKASDASMLRHCSAQVPPAVSSRVLRSEQSELRSVSRDGDTAGHSA